MSSGITNFCLPYLGTMRNSKKITARRMSDGSIGGERRNKLDEIVRLKRSFRLVALSVLTKPDAPTP